MEDFYMAQVFTRGVWLIVLGSDSTCLLLIPTPTSLTLTRRQILSIQSTVDLYQQCLPSSAALVKGCCLMNSYYTTLSLGPEEFERLVSVTPVGDRG
ncbi:hypothetical protein PoB_005259400 [Plakobranchus ocellatus]|uniref:Uncharacterized protein n=1 Tax=Plakobranchus ocellatus TaxID=259542 RepID=A0AAV4C0P4_9GAST|nr:hypothetical protein PoB_005259400 [Plakobranchus ocellatus]